jgi:hypothetical protein
MIEKEVFEKIRKEHGIYASWAVWKDEGSTPASNIDNLSIFDLDNNLQLLKVLKPSIVMVALNWGGHNGVINKDQLNNYQPFTNFHSTHPNKDYIIRYAFKDTEFYGAYMTDIIKFYSATNADENYLNDPNVLEDNKKIFEAELNDLNCKNELIIAFGEETFKKLNLPFRNKFNIIQIPHFCSRQANKKENYRREVLEKLKDWKR